MLLPAATNDPASMVASAHSIYKQVAGGSSGSGGEGEGGSTQAVAPRATAAAREAAASRPATPAPGHEAGPAAREHPPPPPRVAAKPRFSLQHVLE